MVPTFVDQPTTQGGTAVSVAVLQPPLLVYGERILCGATHSQGKGMGSGATKCWHACPHSDEPPPIGRGGSMPHGPQGHIIQQTQCQAATPPEVRMNAIFDTSGCVFKYQEL